MDPSAFQRRGAGTTSMNTIDILRSLFALDPTTNLPISSFYTMTTDGIGGVNWMSEVKYISSSLGIDNLPSTLQGNSTSISYIIPGLSTLSTAIGNGGIPGSVTGGQLVSTTTGLTNGLGSLGYISTLGLNSTITGLGSLGFLSSISSLQPTLNSTLQGLGSLGFLSTVQPTLNSTLQGLGSLGFLSSAQLPLTSTVAGLNVYGYVNTVNLVSTTVNLQSNLNQLMSPAAISTFVVYGTNTFTSGVSIGILNINPQDVSTLSSGIGYNLTGFLISSFLFSTVIGLGTVGYLSSAVIQPSLNSTIQGLGSLGFLSTGATQPSLNSTVQGLGSLGFLSTGATQPSLNSTIQGLGSLGFLSTSVGQVNLNSTVEGLGSLGFLSTSLNQININSTVQGLGSLGFLSTVQPSLNSTIQGLGTFGFLSSISSIQPTLNSTLQGLGTYGFISTSVGQVNLNSTIEGLGTFGFLSTAVTQGNLNSTIQGLGTVGFLSSISSIQPTLNSTLAGLTSLGYVSTSMLYSTSIGLANSFYIVNTGQIYITGGTATIGNASNVIYLSSFLHSSITYSGNNGAFIASNAGTGSQPLYFSSANFKLDSFSSYITNKSLISIEAHPNILFSKIAYPTSSKDAILIYMSSMLQDGVNFMSTNLSQTAFYPTDNTNSNFFNQPIRITFPGNILTYRNPYVLTHYLPNAVSSNSNQGLYTSNVTLAFGSTNSLFVSIQNLPS
jgi:hypothetical protein